MLILLASIITNTIPAVTGASIGSINWTTVISVLVFSLTAMATILKLIGPNKSIKEDVLRESNYIKGIVQENKDQKEELKDIHERQEEFKDDSYKKREEIKKEINDIKIEIEKSKAEWSASSKSIEELKENYKSLAVRLDELLKQMLEWFSS